MLASLAFFFRDAAATGFARLYGDGYDAVIEAAILEHWRGVIVDRVPWSTTLWFWPYAGTLGYNDTLFIPALASVPARMLEADPMLAALASHVFMRAIGFAGMYVLLRRGFAVRTPLAVAGAAVFTTANVSLLHMSHAQLLSVGLLPWLGFLLMRTIQAIALGDRRQAERNGVGLALLYGATALSTFYAAWFFAVFVLLLLPGLAIFAGPARRRALAAGSRNLRFSLLMLAGLALLALVPVLVLYLPKVWNGATRGWAAGPALYLVDLRTLFNVGPGNLLWGWLAKGFWGGEDRVGVPLALLTASLMAFAWSARERKRDWPALAIGCATAILVLLTIRWPGGYSAWYLVWRLAPGADAVRTVSRALLFAIVPVVVLTFVWLDRVARPSWLTVLVVALLLVEEIQLRSPLGVDRVAIVRMLAEVDSPPAGCDVFFVVAARRGDWAAEARAIDRAWGGPGDGKLDVRLYPQNVDAMLIASYRSRPTVNGYSSFNPPDWAFADPDRSDYLTRVRAYARRHRLTRLCGLDTRRRPQWFTLSPPAAALAG